MVGEVSMEVCMPFVMSIIVDNFEKVTMGDQFDLIWTWVIILLVMSIVSLLC